MLMRGLIVCVAAAVTALLMPPSVISQSPQDPAPATEPKMFEVVAKRFAFEPATITVTEGDRVRLIVTSGDGVHGLEIKKFRVKKDVPRGGEKVTIDFVASAPGKFEIICSEYCGEGHEEMKGALVVEARPKGPTSR